jgi:hypothetical protein
MFRRYLLPVLAASALVAVGCVPVTEPLGDIEKAKPDKELVGKWTVTKGKGFAELFKTEAVVIDIPEVKGNPKGLMRGVMKQEKDNDLWFFVTTVGKHTYANVIVESKDNGADFLQFQKEGAYEKWKTDAAKHYFVFKYARDGDALTIDCGREGEFAAIADAAKINKSGSPITFYATEAGWLAKYFDKNGPEKIYDGSNALELKREKVMRPPVK